jgi:hypothetical protein
MVQYNCILTTINQSKWKLWFLDTVLEHFTLVISSRIPSTRVEPINEYKYKESLFYISMIWNLDAIQSHPRRRPGKLLLLFPPAMAILDPAACPKASSIMSKSTILNTFACRNIIDPVALPAETILAPLPKGYPRPSHVPKRFSTQLSASALLPDAILNTFACWNIIDPVALPAETILAPLP